MKIKLGSYFVVGGFGQKSVFISKDYKLPYYVSTKELETKGAGLSTPAGATFAVTVLLRYIDLQNRQANLFLLVLGLLMIYFSVEWIFRGLKIAGFEICSCSAISYRILKNSLVSHERYAIIKLLYYKRETKDEKVV
ncbi:hypothetical protein ACVR05_02100 [Streptococcus caprae]|uniref:Uncharacterized protein n=1 Tax=Streptococcus caprae TaxID=1640501 RepID=A0ABV8CWJ2_9STRE